MVTLYKKPVANFNSLLESDQKRATKHLYISFMIIFSDRNDRISQFRTIMYDWANGIEVPLDIYILYVYQCGFYVHSIYATIYVDTIKSDFYLMIAHHVLTIMLLAFSYAVRYHKLGVLVIFCHDICDVLLEIAKIFIQTKDRNGKFHVFNEIMANIFFGFFIGVWILCRLYWYPLKVLYAAGRFFFPVAPFVTTFNVMLWLLLMMNIYWFWFMSTLSASNRCVAAVVLVVVVVMFAVGGAVVAAAATILFLFFRWPSPLLLLKGVIVECILELFWPKVTGPLSGEFSVRLPNSFNNQLYAADNRLLQLCFLYIL
ncbi:ceramide synthase 1-like [Saccoglossus kowalevskii]